ncbi:RidA family protein [Tenggerimyces flavus]|uniref:RidA family protein n=1 Tax=Tenggerimyces flavus TaxID=1708749 RepID=A0ABV7Y3U4_9ACTN|nr:RidA family protein [Tenggerimyces flavus]MBM7790671.1 enamine deaminase RidA (YjgF/YER057c/UK114 family) [Tenggerimyces flavus]
MSNTYLNPEGMHASPAFSQAVRVPAGYDTIYVGGQNGVGPDGTVVGPGIAEQSKRAMENLQASLKAAGAELSDVVKWTILIADGVSLEEGFAAVGPFIPQPPPAITGAFVVSLAVPGALVEIEAIAAVKPAGD